MMNEEKQGAERELEAKAIAAQHKSDIEHLRNNVHPSLRDSISLGDVSNGSNQTLSDYSVLILTERIKILAEEIAAMRLILLTEEEHTAIQNALSLHSQQIQTLTENFEKLRLILVPNATPETPDEEHAALHPELDATQELNPHLGAMADEPSKVVPIPESAETLSLSEEERVAAAIKLAKEQDEEHRRLNTKELPQ